MINKKLAFTPWFRIWRGMVASAFFLSLPNCKKNTSVHGIERRGHTSPIAVLITLLPPQRMEEGKI